MANRGPLMGVAVLAAVLGVLVVVGGVVGVGPLASTTPADQVTDPREMIARSLQSILDANAVHLDATVGGTIPGALLGRPEERLVLDGTTAQADLQPRDARTGASVDSPPLDVALETVTVWDGAWYRTSADGPWTRASLGGARPTPARRQPAHARGPAARLARPAGPGPDRHRRPVRGRVGHLPPHRPRRGDGPGRPPGRAAPRRQRSALPEVVTTITLDADAGTLRPVHLELDMRSEDGSVDLRLALDASRWDDPGIVIEEPPTGS